MPRRPAPIVLPKCPMDTLWEVDESSDVSKQRFTPSEPLRSVFEDDDDDEVRHSFPLPPSVKRFFSSRMNLPIHSPPKRSTPPRPRRAPPPPPRVPSPVPVRRSVSPTSSASSSDTETPRTPPITACSLPKVLPTPPPAEWESAIDALFEFAEEQDEMQRPKLAPRSVSAPTVPARSARRTQTPFSPGSDSSFVCMSPTAAFPMSPTSTSTGWSVDRPLMSPGFMPMSVSPPSQRWLSLAS